MRQVAISHYIKAWDTGQVFNELDPVRMHWSSRSAAARTCCTICGGREAGLEPLMTFCLARAHAVAIDAVLRHSRDPFAMGTRRWRPLRAQTRLSGRGGNAEYHGERSIPRRAACIATCVDFILIPFSFALNP